MSARAITLRELQKDLEAHLRQCADSGEPVLVQLPDGRLLSVQRLEPDDDLINDLIEQESAFCDLLVRSLASPRKPFQPGADGNP